MSSKDITLSSSRRQHPASDRYFLFMTTFYMLFILFQPGLTTDEIDELAHNLCIEAGAYPSPLHYNGFPKSVCTSVNNVIVHGIPDLRLLQNGDIVNVDITVSLINIDVIMIFLSRAQFRPNNKLRDPLSSH